MKRAVVALALAVVLLAVPVEAVAAPNAVPATRLGVTVVPITADTLKPEECAGIALSNIVVGSGTFSGTGLNDLILGGPGPDRITGSGGDDCILGGGGDDNIRGNSGRDVCLGGAGRNTYSNCQITSG